MESKNKKVSKSVHEQLGIDINVSRVAQCFNKDNKELNEVLEKLNAIKKRGIEKPVNVLIAPKKPQISKEEWKESPIRKEYEEKKKVFDAEVRKYEQFSSDEYVKANLAHKLTKKLKVVIDLLNKNNEKPTEARTERIKEIFKELEGGISKPVFGDKIEKNGRTIRPITGREIRMRFDSLGELGESPEILKQRLSEITMQFSETNKLFDLKEEISNNTLKFSESVKTTISFVLQELVYDVLSLAIKDCKKTGKVTLSVDNLRNDVVLHSAFSALFYNLPCLKKLQEHIIRKREYEFEKKKHDSEMKSKKKSSMIKTFEECERSNGFMKEVDGKKVWAGLCHEEKDVNFMTYVGRLFDNLKVDLKQHKMKISSRAKELVSCLMYQFLTVLSTRFDIHKEHRSKILALEHKTVKSEKTIKFETVIEIFELILVSNNEKVIDTLKKASLFRQKLKDLKK